MSQHERNKSLTVDWLTPGYITEALPTFDLDPCASAHQEMPTARRMVVLPEDGLAVEWQGSVWLNPPYDNKEIGRWLEKMAQHNNGVALVFARVETKWFHRWVWPFASGFFFFQGRLSFVHGQALTERQRHGGNAASPSVLVSYGNQCREWIRNLTLSGYFVPTQQPINHPIAAIGTAHR